MNKHVARAAAVLAGAVLAMPALASPAAAEVVPDGCVGTVYYACTGGSAPPVTDYPDPEVVYEVPVELHSPTTTFVPGMTVGGQTVGGVVVPVGGLILAETTVWVGGPTSPIYTGVPAPVNFCAFVVCYVAGEPVDVPGLPLPLVPVVIPEVRVPSRTVTVPTVTTLPEQSTPAVVAPAIDVEAVTVRVFVNRADYNALGIWVCAAGGGEAHQAWDPVNGGRYECDGGSLAPAAAVLFDKGRW